MMRYPIEVGFAASSEGRISSHHTTEGSVRSARTALTFLSDRHSRYLRNTHDRLRRYVGCAASV